MPRKRVFISYAHADADTFAKELRSQLIMAGHHAFFDIETIVPGSDWEQSILEGIQSADCFIAVVSPSSLQSTPCNREWTHALTTGKYFIPIFLHEEQHLGTIPSSVLQRQGLDFHNPDEYEAKFERLLRTIERLEPIPPPPQAQQEAAPPRWNQQPRSLGGSGESLIMGCIPRAKWCIVSRVAPHSPKLIR